MRLIDRPLEPLHGVSGLTPPHCHGERPANASVRYVLDLAASQACGDLVRNGEGLFEPDNPLFRMPVETFWLECFTEREEGAAGPNTRVGYLVRSGASGRAGVITPFTETSNGLTQQLPCQICFDLDATIVREKGMYALRHPHIGHIADLLKHCVLVPDQDRLAAMHVRAGVSATPLGALAEGTWFALPLLFAFVALLNSPQVVETRPSDLERLNRARTRRGRAPLLDHVEVRLALGDSARGGSAGADARVSPRLHFVRGHVVRRSGKTFWRQPHLRGDSQKSLVFRTVRVTAGRSVRADAAQHVRQASYGA
jgi:hypothetical protein